MPEGGIVRENHDFERRADEFEGRAVEEGNLEIVILRSTCHGVWSSAHLSGVVGIRGCGCGPAEWGI